MLVIGIVIGLIVGGGAGILATTSVLRKKLLAKSQQILVDAEEKAEVIKKDKILQAKEKYLQMKTFDHSYDFVMRKLNSICSHFHNIVYPL